MADSDYIRDLKAERDRWHKAATERELELLAWRKFAKEKFSPLEPVVCKGETTGRISIILVEP